MTENWSANPNFDGDTVIDKPDRPVTRASARRARKNDEMLKNLPNLYPRDTVIEKPVLPPCKPARPVTGARLPPFKPARPVDRARAVTRARTRAVDEMLKNLPKYGDLYPPEYFIPKYTYDPVPKTFCGPTYGFGEITEMELEARKNQKETPEERMARLVQIIGPQILIPFPGVPTGRSVPQPRGPTALEQWVEKYVAAGLNREAVSFAARLYRDDAAKVHEFVEKFTRLREMVPDPPKDVAQALFFVDMDMDRVMEDGLQPIRNSSNTSSNIVNYFRKF